MSSRLETLQVARLAPKLLGESTDLVRRFLRSQSHPDGSFRGRAGQSDLYYTVFGVEGLLALRDAPDARALAGYLRGFGDGAGLDLVHLGCLARLWADLALLNRSAGGDAAARAAALATRLERHRAADGGYHATPGAEHGSIYGCFVALTAYQDLQLPLPDPCAVAQCVEGLRAPDGGYANERQLPMGTVPGAAAAVTILRALDRPIDPAVARWLLDRHHPQGGFCAVPGAPVPDLLSTATALHALSSLHAPLDAVREKCLDFVDSLWTNQGGFYGTWPDDTLDCEYTYYALLALGHLAV